MAFNFDQTGTPAAVSAAAANIVGTETNEMNMTNLVAFVQQAITQVDATNPSRKCHAVARGKSGSYTVHVEIFVESVNLGPDGKILSGSSKPI